MDEHPALHNMRKHELLNCPHPKLVESRLGPMKRRRSKGEEEGKWNWNNIQKTANGFGRDLMNATKLLCAFLSKQLKWIDQNKGGQVGEIGRNRWKPKCEDGRQWTDIELVASTHFDRHKPKEECRENRHRIGKNPGEDLQLENIPHHFNIE